MQYAPKMQWTITKIAKATKIYKKKKKKKENLQVCVFLFICDNAFICF